MNFNKLKILSKEELHHLCIVLGINELDKIKKEDLIISILKKTIEIGDEIIGEGVLEILKDGFGFLRSVGTCYLPGSEDIYVSPSQIKKFNLRTGDTITGIIRPPKESERYCALLKIEQINYVDVSNYIPNILFEKLTPIHANYKIQMEHIDNYKEDLTHRILDLVAPIGKGQRGLIVAPPKAGKTLLLQNIAKSININYKDFALIMLLIDERPEEVTEMQRLVTADIISSTFDEPATRHIQVSEIVLERAKRLVEQQKNVIILLDSITRLARAYNTVTPKSGRVLTGGLDANALTRPKRFFGAARNVAEGGSLTIIATALVETGSKMDEVIYEEFKGTGNMELHLSRKIADKRIYPAIDYHKSGTRKEELLYSKEELENIWLLRKMMSHLSDIDIIKFMHQKLVLYQNNHDFLNSLINIYNSFSNSINE